MGLTCNLLLESNSWAMVHVTNLNENTQMTSFYWPSNWKSCSCFQWSHSEGLYIGDNTYYLQLAEENSPMCIMPNWRYECAHFMVVSTHRLSCNAFEKQLPGQQMRPIKCMAKQMLLRKTFLSLQIWAPLNCSLQMSVPPRTFFLIGLHPVKAQATHPPKVVRWATDIFLPQKLHPAIVKRTSVQGITLMLILIWRRKCRDDDGSRWRKIDGYRVKQS